MYNECIRTSFGHYDLSSMKKSARFETVVYKYSIFPLRHLLLLLLHTFRLRSPIFLPAKSVLMMLTR